MVKVSNSVIDILLYLLLAIIIFSYFTNRDVYRAISKANSEYMLWMHEHGIDIQSFTGPTMTVDSKKSLKFTWESKELFQGQKLTQSIAVPRSVFAETEITGMGPWVDWFKARKKINQKFRPYR